AAYDGSKEIGFTILSMTLSLVAVFIPVLLLPGVVGKLFNEFAVTISVAILISGFISMTFTPMLCSRFLRPHQEKRAGGLTALSEHAFGAMLGMYRSTLKLALEYKGIVLMIFVGMLAATAFLFTVMPKGFMPSEDTGQVVAMTEGRQGISFDS